MDAGHRRSRVFFGPVETKSRGLAISFSRLSSNGPIAAVFQLISRTASSLHFPVASCMSFYRVGVLSLLLEFARPFLQLNLTSTIDWFNALSRPSDSSLVPAFFAFGCSWPRPIGEMVKSVSGFSLHFSAFRSAHFYAPVVLVHSWFGGNASTLRCDCWWMVQIVSCCAQIGRAHV